MPRTTLLRLLPLLLVLLPACADEAAPVAVDSRLTSDDLSLHFVTFNKLQAHAEGVPCNPDEVPPLAAAWDLAEGLRAEGDRVVIGAVGDTTVYAPTITRHLTSRLGARARGRVILDALAEAGVEVLVPGLSDFQADATEFLDDCIARDIPLLMTNVLVEGYDDRFARHLVFEHEGLRVAALGILPRGNSAGALVFTDNELFTIEDPKLAIAREIELLREEDSPDFVIVYSGLPEANNRLFAAIDGVNYVLGTSESGRSASRVLYEGNAGLLMARSSGREVAQTTFHVADRQLRFTDISSRDRVALNQFRNQRELDGFAELYGTSDAQSLAPLVNPGNPQAFLDFIAEHESEADWLAETSAIQSSSFEHHAADLAPVAEGHPITAVLGGQGAAIRAQVDAMKMPREQLVLVEMPPRAEDCVSCHSEQVSFWETTAHAGSADTLRELGRQNDGNCLLCHAMGYNRPAGFRDVRLVDPLGGVSCYSCHEVTQLHALSPEFRTNPMHFIGDRTGILPNCDECHTIRRTPAFDAEAVIDQVACPPMRSDDPAILQARTETVETISELREQGLTVAFHEYLEGRALLGLGRVDEAVLQFRIFAAQVTEADVLVVLDSASLLEIRGETKGALEVLRSATERLPNEPRLIMQSAQLLVKGTQEAARDAERAVALLEMVLPKDLSVAESTLEMRKVQVEAYYALGDEARGRTLLQAMIERFPQDEDVRAMRKRFNR